MTAQVASAAYFFLAKSPYWDAVRERVLWVDIPAGEVFEGRLERGRVVVDVQHSFDEFVSAVVCSRDGTMLVAESCTLTEVTTDGDRHAGRRLPASAAARRFNDGTCDSAGRFLIGTLGLGAPIDDQVLARVDPHGLTLLDDDLTMSNGLGFSALGDVLHSVDSVPGIVYARSYDAMTGDVGPRRELFRVSDGTPDGLCVDTDGHLWIAIWGAGQVRRYAIDGALLATLDLPAPHVSSVAFVGGELDRLLVTTARVELDAQQLAAAPASGHLFLADVGATGIPVPYWSSLT